MKRHQKSVANECIQEVFLLIQQREVLKFVCQQLVTFPVVACVCKRESGVRGIFVQVMYPPDIRTCRCLSFVHIWSAMSSHRCPRRGGFGSVRRSCRSSFRSWECASRVAGPTICAGNGKKKKTRINYRAFFDDTAPTGPVIIGGGVISIPQKNEVDLAWLKANTRLPHYGENSLQVRQCYYGLGWKAKKKNPTKPTLSPRLSPDLLPFLPRLRELVSL